jgi:hypothetical protein
LSPDFNQRTVPDWISLDENWQGYRISTVPWIADVARVLGILPIEDTPEEWIGYLESLGLKEIIPVSCKDFFEDKLYC